MFDRWSPRLLSVLRIVAAFLYVQHGTSKLFGVPPAGKGATVELFSRLGAAGVIEIVGGTLILLGLFTRPTALICSGEMAFAYFLAHAPRGPLPLLNQGELPVLFCFIFLYLAAAGSGPWSVDAARTRPASA
jgi:putative oxidoreductase